MPISINNVFRQACVVISSSLCVFMHHNLSTYLVRFKSDPLAAFSFRAQGQIWIGLQRTPRLIRNRLHAMEHQHVKFTHKVTVNIMTADDLGPILETIRSAALLITWSDFKIQQIWFWSNSNQTGPYSLWTAPCVFTELTVTPSYRHITHCDVINRCHDWQLLLKSTRKPQRQGRGPFHEG